MYSKSLGINCHVKLSNSTQEQIQEQPQDHLMNCKTHDDAGFSIYNFARFVNGLVCESY